MSNRVREITCYNCDHTWTVDLDELDEENQTLYKGDEPTSYRVACPRCQTNNVFPAPDEG